MNKILFQNKTKPQLRGICMTLAYICRDLQWMARRYADGRHTYAPNTVNEHTRTLLELGIELCPGAEGTIWASDGGGRSFDGLDQEHLTPGHPVATGLLLGLPPRTHLAEELLRLLDLPEDAGIAAAVERVMELKRNDPKSVVS